MSESFKATWNVIAAIGVVVALGATLIGGYSWMDNRLDALEEKPKQPSATITPDQSLPIGTIVAYGGVKPPEGWLLCQGQKIKDKYPDLKDVIGHAFKKEKDDLGIDEYRLPDLRGKTVIGAGSGKVHNPGSKERALSSRELGKEHGYENHLLTIEEIPMHVHQVKQPLDDFSLDAMQPGEIKRVWRGQPSIGSWETELGPKNGGNSHNNMQPSLVVNFIIKAK